MELTINCSHLFNEFCRTPAYLLAGPLLKIDIRWISLILHYFSGLVGTPALILKAGRLDFSSYSTLPGIAKCAENFRAKHFDQGK